MSTEETTVSDRGKGRDSLLAGRMGGSGGETHDLAGYEETAFSEDA